MAETLLTVAAWADSVDGHEIDRDKMFKAQCWDLWADYAIRCHGASLLSTYTATTGIYAGLAGSLYANFPARDGIEKQFSRVRGTAGIRAGDVLIWGRCRAHPETHVAVALAAPRGGMALVMSQNDLGSATAASGATRRTSLSTDGLLGYLRPRRDPRKAASGTAVKRLGRRAAHVRTEPSTAAAVVRTLPAASLVTLLGWTKGQRLAGKRVWYRVPGGWVHRSAFKTFQTLTLRKLKEIR